MFTAEKWDNLYSQHQNYQSGLPPLCYQILDIFVNFLVLLNIEISKPRHFALDGVNGVHGSLARDIYGEISAYN